jgi:nucleoside-diphosphate-sugar epimerase
VSLLPSGIIGPNFTSLTPTLRLLADIEANKFPFLPDFRFLFVDARDIARTIPAAIAHGRAGVRYVLSHEQPNHIGELIALARQALPGRRIHLPLPIATPWLLRLARLLEGVGRLTGREPLLSATDAEEYAGVVPQADTQLAREELHFEQRPMLESVRDTLLYWIDTAKGR